MTAHARLFPIEDIVAVITGATINRFRSHKVDKLVNYVTGLQTMPEKGSDAQRTVVAAIRSQLPSGLDRFGVINLIDLVMRIDRGQGEEQMRATLVGKLEQRYGSSLPLCPEQDFETSPESLVLLRSIAESPGTILTLD
ncbi:MAG: hypothetical protein ACR2QH_13160 [Geminicoccaceae bacterium]